jgi:sugar lactone lactonase YvrE
MSSPLQAIRCTRSACRSRSVQAPIATASLERWGHDLHRPECVLATASGDVFVPDCPGGITVIRRHGLQQTWRAATTLDLRPNGIAIAPDGSFLIANLGDEGGVWRLRPDGSIEPFLVEVNGVTVPPANFVTTDEDGRTWISVSTRRRPRQLAWRRDVADGFVVLVDRRGARIVADALAYTNEVRPDPSGRWVYAVETFGRRLARFPIRPSGELGPKEIVIHFGHGCFPDGLAFDEAGGIWLTSLVSNRLMHWHECQLHTVVEDINPEYVETVERAFAGGTMEAGHLGVIPGTRLQQLTSVAFGDEYFRTIYLGSLHASCVYRCRSPIAGAPPPHIRFPIPG